MVRQSLRQRVLYRLRTKTAGKPLRPRVETYALTEDGKILTGLYPDGSVGVYGGGVGGDSLEAAAKKEYREEGGVTLKNVEKLPVKPVTKLWKDDPSVGESESAKHKARREQFSGSKTIFMVGEVGEKAKVVDGSKLKDVKPRTVDELIHIQRKSLDKGDEEMADIKKARLDVLERLRTKTAAAIEGEEEPVSYRPEFHAHEVGHHRFQKSLGRAGHKVFRGAGTGALLAGGGLMVGGALAGRPGLMSSGTLLASASSIPRLIEEAEASRRGLKELEGELSPEEMAQAKKRLRTAWLSYAALPTMLAVPAAATVAGTALKNRALILGGLGGQLAAAPLGVATSWAANRGMRGGEGRSLSQEELEAQHQRLAPGLALVPSKKELDIGAGYVSRPVSEKKQSRIQQALRILQEPLGMSDEKVDEVVRRGAILMGPT